MNFLMKTLVSLLLCSTTIAADHVGVIVKVQGNAELLADPSTKVIGKGPHVLFEGKYYQLQKMRLGLKVDNGAVIRTNKDSKVKIVFKNGDQFNIGEATSYRISWTAKKMNGKDDASTVDLMYGTLRGIVSKKGPRSGMKVQTKHAVMGVRGTDFYIGQKGTSGESSISVLRGKVSVTNALVKTKHIEVKQGFSAGVKKEERSMNVEKTTKNDLVEIQKESTIKQNENQASVVVQKELAQLEKKAVENTLSDIKEYDPALYNSLKDKKIDDVDKINKVVVGKVFEKAPEKKLKIGIDELNLDENAYEKYFKID